MPQVSLPALRPARGRARTWNSWTPTPGPWSRCPIGEPVTLSVIRGLERLDLRVRPREAKA
ncbi:MAG: hypothetical protein ACLQED_12895 [Desulfobaccales bacterium]